MNPVDSQVRHSMTIRAHRNGILRRFRCLAFPCLNALQDGFLPPPLWALPAQQVTMTISSRLAGKPS